jgi:glycosyltransferase involved in cell wall biosynthesis
MTADTVGGVWSYAVELCSSLAPLGGEIALATFGGPLSRAQQHEAARLSNVQLYTSDYRLEWMQSPWESLAQAAAWLSSIERRTTPDVVHLNHLVHGDLEWSAPVVVVGHSCVYSWWNAVRGGVPDDSWRQYHARVTRSLRCASRVVAPSRAMLLALCRYYGPLGRTQVIPNARDPSRYRPATKDPYIISAGRLWDEAKNVQALCEIASSLPWPVLIAGPDTGPDGQTCSLDNVTSLGTLTPAAMAHWLGRASIYAAPALYEPFGLGALEAGLSGCALVLGNLDSLREIWADSALYVTPGSTDDLRDALLELIAHPRALSVFGERARARAQRFNPTSFASAYLQLYGSMCDRREPASCASYSSITH